MGNLYFLFDDGCIEFIIGDVKFWFDEINDSKL